MLKIVTSQDTTILESYRNEFDPSQDSSIGSISAWDRGGPGFKSWQGWEFASENK